MVQNSEYTKESSFGVSPRSNWYLDNVGNQVTFTLGGVSKAGVIKGVDFSDGKVILNPYMGKDFSTGKELDALIPLDERVSISHIISERVHPKGHLEAYLSVSNPGPKILN